MWCFNPAVAIVTWPNSPWGLLVSTQQHLFQKSKLSHLLTIKWMKMIVSNIFSLICVSKLCISASLHNQKTSQWLLPSPCQAKPWLPQPQPSALISVSARSAGGSNPEEALVLPRWGQQLCWQQGFEHAQTRHAAFHRPEAARWGLVAWALI